MTELNYSWKIISVELTAKTFVVEYKSDANVVQRLNMTLTSTDPQAIKQLVECCVPATLFAPPVPPKEVVIDDNDHDALMALTGEATTIAQAQAVVETVDNAADIFRIRVAQALFELGVTPTNVLE